MPTHTAHLRQRSLLEYLAQVRGRVVPFADIRRHLEGQPFSANFGRAYSQRTLQRDIQCIAATYEEEIKGQRGLGYYLAGPAPTVPAGRQRLDELVQLHELLTLPETLAPFVQPETRRPLGLEHLRPLLRAVQARRVVDFTYQKFWDDAPGQRTVEPLLLKEFRGRWYVLGAMAMGRRRGQLTCFGLDRISGLVVSEQVFAPPPGFDAATYYAHAFGIIRPEAAAVPQEVVLRFRPEQGRYALSYPLHASQRLVRQSADEIVLALTIFDTHDLRMELLSYGPEVAVLAPPALRDWLQGQHAEAGALQSVAP